MAGANTVPASMARAEVSSFFARDDGILAVMRANDASNAVVAQIENLSQVSKRFRGCAREVLQDNRWLANYANNGNQFAANLPDFGIATTVTVQVRQFTWVATGMRRYRMLANVQAATLLSLQRLQTIPSGDSRVRRLQRLGAAGVCFLIRSAIMTHMDNIDVQSRGIELFLFIENDNVDVETQWITQRLDPGGNFAFFDSLMATLCRFPNNRLLQTHCMLLLCRVTQCTRFRMLRGVRTQKFRRLLAHLGAIMCTYLSDARLQAAAFEFLSELDIREFNQFDSPLYGMKDYWMRTVMNGMHAHRSDDRAWQSGRFVLWQFVSHAWEEVDVDDARIFLNIMASPYSSSATNQRCCMYLCNALNSAESVASALELRAIPIILQCMCKFGKNPTLQRYALQLMLTCSEYGAIGDNFDAIAIVVCNLQRKLRNTNKYAWVHVANSCGLLRSSMLSRSPNDPGTGSEIGVHTEMTLAP